MEYLPNYPKTGRLYGQPTPPGWKLQFPACFELFPRRSCLNHHPVTCYAIDCTGCCYDPNQAIPGFLAGIFYLIRLGP